LLVYGQVDFDPIHAINVEVFTVFPENVTFNQAPTAITLDNREVTENALADVVGTLTVDDPNTDDAHTFSVDDNRFEVVGTELKLKHGVALDYEDAPTVDVTVTVTDRSNLTNSQTFTVNVLDVAEADDINESPTAITLDDREVTENTKADVVGTVTVTDPNADDTFTYSVSDNRFEIFDDPNDDPDQGPQLKLKNGLALDYETESYVDLTVTVTDSGGLTKAQDFTINVLDQADGDDNEAPTAITLAYANADRTVTENVTAAVVGDLTVTDPNADDTHILSVDDERFEILDGTLKLKHGTALDYEAATTVNVTVTATDSGGLSIDQIFTVNVKDTVAAKIGTSDPDTINGDFGVDFIRPGTGADTVDARGGNDIIVVVGRTYGDQYTQADIDNPTDKDGNTLDVDWDSLGLDLNSVVSPASINSRSESDTEYDEIIGYDIHDIPIYERLYDSLDGGEGTDYLVVYGTVDFTNVTVGNVTVFQVEGTGAGNEDPPTSVAVI
ncbi:hypothetical protein TI05_15320, partial [Achromatium sp. WMS3]